MSGIAKGPLQILLQTASGQWVVLGMGAYTFFPEKVKALLNPILDRALAQAPTQLANQFRMDEPRNGTSHDRSPSPSQAPIIIHTSSNTRNGWTTTVITYAVGAGACWAGYVVLTNTLPDACKDLLPVTRSFFESTAKTLGQGILNVRQALEEQLMGVAETQEELDRKLQQNTDHVIGIENELGEARNDLGELGLSLSRCEDSLMNSQSMHSYTTRGVKLLVRCVAGLLPNQDGFLSELAQFVKEGDEIGPNDGPQQPPTNQPLVRQRSTPQPHSRRYLGADQRRNSSNSLLRRQSSSQMDSSMEEIQELLHLDGSKNNNSSNNSSNVVPPSPYAPHQQYSY